MCMIKDENFIVIHGWMTTKLGLKGTELLVYAAVYGFSQDGSSVFAGSRKYLAEWCNCSLRSIDYALKSLTDKGYIIKHDKTVSGVRLCDYKTAEISPLLQNLQGGTAKTAKGYCKNCKGVLQKLQGGTAKTAHHKIVDNIEDNLEDNSPLIPPEGDRVTPGTPNHTTSEPDNDTTNSNETNPTDTTSQSLVVKNTNQSIPPTAQPKDMTDSRTAPTEPVHATAKSRPHADAMNACEAECDKYTTDPHIRELLRMWLQNRKAKRAAMTANAIRLNLRKLDRLAEESHMPVDDYLEEVVCRGWNAFFPIVGFGGNQTQHASQRQKPMSEETRKTIAALEEFTF